MKNVFNSKDAADFISRINKLTPTSKASWGKMSVDQMLAHCNVIYKYVYESEQFKKPNFFMKLLLKMLVKRVVTSEKPYRNNSKTAPELVMTESKDFEKEKALLISNIIKTQQLGEKHFEGLENFSFGKMTSKEWNNMFCKHLNHHLTQFGV